ncbi:hypothetical protein [Aromatoleum diolicum]|nr:hypothetical protein [Aromatoleum diolicum]
MGMLGLLVGVLAGMARLAFDVPQFASVQAAWHAALMVCAFFGTVISLERAVALARGWAYLAPASAGAGGLALLSGLPLSVAQAMFVAAAAVLVLGSVKVMQRQFALFTATLCVGASCWLLGTLAWIVDGAIQTAVPWWLAFLVITIAGERLELTRFLPVRAASAPLFMLVTGVVVAGAVTSLWWVQSGLMIFSAGLLALAMWLLRYDIARHNARQKGLTRYIALCLLSGYVWLSIGAVIGLNGGFVLSHPWRDAGLHAIALGFVFAMVFGHAPIIFPAISRVRIPYHPVFYLPLLMLHISLAVRVLGGGGDGAGLRQLGALTNAVALLLFIVTMVASIVRGRDQGKGQGRK